MMYFLNCVSIFLRSNINEADSASYGVHIQSNYRIAFGDNEMGRMKSFLRIIGKLVREPKSIGRIFSDAEVWTRTGFEHGFPTVDILDLMPSFSVTVDPYSFLYGTSLPTDIALLRSLASRFDHCRYLEIGTWRGESASNIADIAAECFTIDLPAEEMRNRGYSDNFINAAAFFSNKNPKINHIRQDSRTLDVDELGKFDLMFIDGDHSYEGIKSDTELAFRLLKNPDSIIVWHDYCSGPERVRWSTLAAIIDGSPSYAHHRILHVSNTLCAAYLPEGYKTNYPTFPRLPDKKFRITIEASRIDEEVE